MEVFSFILWLYTAVPYRFRSIRFCTTSASDRRGGNLPPENWEFKTAVIPYFASAACRGSKGEIDRQQTGHGSNRHRRCLFPQFSSVFKLAVRRNRQPPRSKVIVVVAPFRGCELRLPAQLRNVYVSPVTYEDKEKHPRPKSRVFSLCWHLPILPGRFQPSIVGTSELNCRVRDGNGCTLTVISTNYGVPSRTLRTE